MNLDQACLVTSLPRGEQRAFVLHVLYSLEAFDSDSISLEYILQGYLNDFNLLVQPHDPIYNEIQNIIINKDKIDKEIEPLLKKWKIDRLSTMVKLILRYALSEFLYTTQDCALVINEAIELAKGFAEEDSYRFVNGILDSWAKKNNKSNKDKSPE